MPSWDLTDFFVHFRFLSVAKSGFGCYIVPLRGQTGRNMEKINQYKYLQLRQYLINMVLHGKIEKSLPSERELAEMFQVSRVTVRASLNTLLEEKYLVRSPRRGYFINPQSMTEIMRKRKIIGLLIHTGGIAFYDDDPMNYIQEVCQHCIRNNFLLQILTSSPSSLFHDITVSNPDGLLWIGADSGKDIFEKISRETRIPLVGLFNGCRPACGNYIYLNHYYEFYLRTEYLIRCGCRRIFSCCYSPDAEQGYKDALARAGIPLIPELMVKSDQLQEILSAVYDKFHPDGFSLRTNHYSIFQAFIREKGLSVPRDVQLILDNFNEFRDMTITVKPFRKIVSALFHQLVQVMNGRKAGLQKDDFTWALKPGNSTRNPGELG